MVNAIRAGMPCVATIISVVLAAVLGAGAATVQAAPGGTGNAAPPEGQPGGLSLDINVIAKQLDIARSEIQPSLGATVYDFSRQAIETQPQGDNQRSTASCCRRPVSLRTRSASCMCAMITPICNFVSTGSSCRKGSTSLGKRCRRGLPIRLR